MSPNRLPSIVRMKAAADIEDRARALPRLYYARLLAAVGERYGRIYDGLAPALMERLGDTVKVLWAWTPDAPPGEVMRLAADWEAVSPSDVDSMAVGGFVDLLAAGLSGLYDEDSRMFSAQHLTTPALCLPDAIAQDRLREVKNITVWSATRPELSDELNRWIDNELGYIDCCVSVLEQHAATNQPVGRDGIAQACEVPILDLPSDL